MCPSCLSGKRRGHQHNLNIGNHLSSVFHSVLECHDACFEKFLLMTHVTLQAFLVAVLSSYTNRLLASMGLLAHEHDSKSHSLTCIKS